MSMVLRNNSDIFMKKALITGASGQLGYELQRTRPAGWELLPFDSGALDITDREAVMAALALHRPELVINAAAYTAVDKAESDVERAYAVNAVGAANLAQAAMAVGARLIHVSTDFVFDGLKSSPYLPEDATSPVSVYGASKLAGEQAVADATRSGALILRTAWVYSAHGANFVKTILRLARERDTLRVIAEQVGTPTWAKGLAEAIWQAAELPQLNGIYNWTDAGVASWYDFALAIVEEAAALGLIPRVPAVLPIRAVDYPLPASRPAYSVLDKTATWAALDMVPSHWRTALKNMLTDLKERPDA